MARRGMFAVRAALAALPVALLIGLLAPTAVGAARPREPQSAPPKAFIVVDVATGTVLAGDHLHEALPPASTAKIMTAVTAVERLAPDAPVNVSPLAAAQPASRINMQAGQQWPLNNALASLLMASANDAAYALAETVGGSLDGFVAAMQQTAARLGMQDSTFADPAGLDDDSSFNGGPRMSAFDIAIATRNALAVPELAQLGAQRTYEFVDPAGLQRSLTNHNRMLPNASRAYPYATGFKTGFTNRAGHTLAATATRDGRSLIAVVLNTYDTYGWAVQLLDQGFATANESGTGEKLPAVAVSPFAQRAVDQQAFLAVARGPGVSPTAAAAPAGSETPESPASPTTTVATASSVVDGNAIASQQAAGDGDGGGGSLVDVWWLVLVLGLLLVAAFILRRRAVRRQRARRIARQRHRAAKMRSGGLPVVDGRYGPNATAGTESHVRIRPIHDER